MKHVFYGERVEIEYVEDIEKLYAVTIPKLRLYDMAYNPYQYVKEAKKVVSHEIISSFRNDSLAIMIGEYVELRGYQYKIEKIVHDLDGSSIKYYTNCQIESEVNSSKRDEIANKTKIKALEKLVDHLKEEREEFIEKKNEEVKTDKTSLSEYKPISDIFYSLEKGDLVRVVNSDSTIRDKDTWSGIIVDIDCYKVKILVDIKGLFIEKPITLEIRKNETWFFVKKVFSNKDGVNSADEARLRAFGGLQ